MWIITDDPVLFNTDTGIVIGFEAAVSEQYEFQVTLNGTPVYRTDFPADAIDYIYGLAQLLGAASVPIPPVGPDGKPDPF